LAPLLELVQKTFKGYEKTKFFHHILEKFNELFVFIEKDETKNINLFIKLEDFIKQILQGTENV